MSYIYGIDGGISFCGYSIFNDKEELVLAGRVSTPSSIRTLSFNQKLFKITTKFKSLFDQYPPSVIVCEKPRMAVMFQGKAMEPHNLYKIHLVYGAIIAQLDKHDPEVLMINISKIFWLITGHNNMRIKRAEKKLIMKNYILNYIEEHEWEDRILSSTQDTYDAISIALYFFRKKQIP